MDERQAPPAPAPLTAMPVGVKLSLEEATVISDHINRKAVVPNDACPVCGSPNNSVLEDVYQLPVLTTVAVIGGVHQPLLATACMNCGFVRFFNRLIVDSLIRAETEEAGRAASAEQNKDGG